MAEPRSDVYASGIAPLPVISDVFRCSLLWRNGYYSRNAVNVLHFHAPSKSASDVWTSLDAHVLANMWAGATVDMTCQQVNITPLDGSSNTSIHFPAVVAKWAGAQATGDIVPQASPIIKLTTNTRGRRARGRVFIPYPAEGKVSLGLLDTTVRTNSDTAWVTFIANTALDGVHLCVASYVSATQHEVTQIQTETYLGTQRRRQLRP